MIEGRVDPNWPRLLGLSVHEFRTPVTVVAGYIRMLLKDGGGPLSEQQRRLLQEAEKSCGRLSALLAEMSDLANLEAGSATFNRSALDLHALLSDAVGTLTVDPDREVRVSLEHSGAPAAVEGDPTRLKAAFASVIEAVRRELVTSDELVVREQQAQHDGRRASWIALGDRSKVDALSAADPTGLVTFDEWRGGCGLGLAIARRIIEAHGGRVWSPAAESRAGAVVALPLLTPAAHTAG